MTRAVGVEPTLALDVYRDRVRAGDRFLLCSDGLTRMLPDADDPQHGWSTRISSAAVDGLIAATLEAGAPDNVTVLIVEACAVAGSPRILPCVFDHTAVSTASHCAAPCSTFGF